MKRFVGSFIVGVMIGCWGFMLAMIIRSIFWSYIIGSFCGVAAYRAGYYVSAMLEKNSAEPTS